MATLKESLDEALLNASHLQTQLTTSQGEATKLRADLDAANTKISGLEGEKTQLSTDLAAANTKISGLEGEKAQLSTELAEVKGKSDRLDERANEQLAGAGIKTNASKGAPKTLNTDKEDPKALIERYNAASPADKAKMRAEQGKELEAAAAELDREAGK